MDSYINSRTKDVRLFASIAAMGIPWQPGDCAAVDGGQRVWIFGERSDCGNWELSALLRWWHDSSLHTKEPGNAFHVVKATMASDKGLRDAFRSHTSFWQQRRGKANIIIAGEPSEPPAEAGPHATDDSLFAAAASACGFVVTDAKAKGTRRVVGLSDKSQTFPYTLREITAWWHDKDFERQNGQHPFAYAKAAAKTYDAAIRAIKTDRPLVRWQPKGSVGMAFIHPDCSKQTEEKVAGWLKGYG